MDGTRRKAATMEIEGRGGDYRSNRMSDDRKSMTKLNDQLIHELIDRKIEG
jgi:hypothetical protein